MNSNGFCLINNVAIGAAYAMSRYGREASHSSGGGGGRPFRVAIVDFDIHVSSARDFIC
jgi:acetoin utilization deacetylase AcuC-like enzyme